MAPFIVFTETDGICDGRPVFPLLRVMQVRREPGRREGMGQSEFLTI
jgi:hypothetical protein